MKNYVHGGDIYRNKVKTDHSVSINPLEWPDGLKKQIEDIVKDPGNACIYPDIFCEELKCAILRYTGTNPEKIVCGNGASELISGICNLIRPRRVLLLSPCYGGYERAARVTGAKIIYAPLDEKSGFADVSSILKVLRSSEWDIPEKGRDIIFVGNPSNPVGSLIPKDTYKELVRECEDRGIILVVDECFAELSMTEAEYRNQYGGIRGRTLIKLRAFTKSFRLAGLRLGYALFEDEETAERLEELLPEWNISTPAMKAGISCLNYECALPEEKRYMRASLEFIRRERKRVSEALSLPGVKVYGSDANYILLYSETGLYERLLQKGILIRDCSNIRGLKKGYYRISLRSSEDNDRLIREIYGINQGKNCL